MAHDFVDLQTFIPGIALRPLYATEENVFQERFYPVEQLFLRRGTAEKLKGAYNALFARGLQLCVADAYRPYSVQKAMWKKGVSLHYLADPAVGSKHNRGAAVDVSFVGRLMPTEVDTFSEKAHLDCEDLPEEAKAHRAELQTAMREAGFLPYSKEWWHFDDADWRGYPVCDLSYWQLLSS